jgi:hypothetical protein
MQEIEGDREYRSRINLYKKDGSMGKGRNDGESSSRGGAGRNKKGDKMNDDAVDHEDVSVNMNGMDDEEVRLDELLDDMSLGDDDDNHGDDDGDYNDVEDQGVGHSHEDDDNSDDDL